MVIIAIRAWLSHMIFFSVLMKLNRKHTQVNKSNPQQANIMFREVKTKSYTLNLDD